MKKYYSFIALAALALASCTSDEFVGGNENVTTESNGKAIGFDFGVPNLTRGSLSGEDAAAALSNQFVVFGTKHTEAEDKTADNDEVVFTNYSVEWTDNTAGTTESNTHNWEYVGVTPYTSGVTPAVSSGTQTIKYWDYSAAQGYTFYAFAGKDLLSNNSITVEKLTEGTTLYEKGYKITVNDVENANLDKLYYSDRTPVAKSEYGKPVVLTFRNLGSRVRVGFYETVPGYSVKVDKFYFDEDAEAAVTTFIAMDTENNTNFAAALQNIGPKNGNSLTITYYDGTDGTENHVKVTNSGMDYAYYLTLGTGIISAEKLATTSATPTWDNDGGYTTVYPFEQNTNPMLIRVDYTLTSEDGSGETIEVKNARVVVPTNYVQWKSNYAYTYLFKISDNTNGTTGTVPTDPDDPTSGDPEGLYPITFDAVAVTATDYTQETITTVASNNVTTYAVNSDATTVGEYKVGETIFVVDENTTTHEPLTVSSIAANTAENAIVYTATTEGDAISEATVLAKLNGAPNGITLTTANPAATIVTEANSIPQADGSTYTLAANKAVQFTPGAAGTYVYVYTNTAYVATEYETAGEDTFDATVTYYFKTDNDVYYAASGLTADNFANYKAKLYKVKTAGTVGAYDIKVIIIKE